MTDPHVVWLQYRPVPPEHVSYENPPPVELETAAFFMRLSEGVAQFDMQKHYATEDEAREAVKGFLRSWEIDSALRFGDTGMQFSFERSHVIDRNPPPPGTALVVTATGRLTMKSSVAATVHVTRRAYPAPPTDFRASPDVETLWQRYQFHRQGREPLPSMAYFCLTQLEVNAGGRRGAASRYALSREVLAKLGELTSKYGDAKTARKAKAMGRPHTPAEVTWLDSAIKRIIQRVGEVDAGATNLQEITLKDLPPV